MRSYTEKHFEMSEADIRDLVMAHLQQKKGIDPADTKIEFVISPEINNPDARFYGGSDSYTPASLKSVKIVTRIEETK